MTTWSGWAKPTVCSFTVTNGKNVCWVSATCQALGRGVGTRNSGVHVLPPEHKPSMFPFQTSLLGGRCVHGGFGCRFSLREVSLIGVTSRSAGCQGMKTPQIRSTHAAGRCHGLGGDVGLTHLGSRPGPAWPAIAPQASCSASLPIGFFVCKGRNILRASLLTQETGCAANDDKSGEDTSLPHDTGSPGRRLQG